jgi:hypothetical protein
VTGAILTLVLGYGLLALLLLTLHLRSTLAWQLKAAATLAAGALTVLTLDAAHGLLGWPTGRALPEEFRLHGVHIDEPRAGGEGAIHLWVTHARGDDEPLPRAHRLPYSRELHERLHRARGRLSEGEAIHGRLAERRGEPVPELELYTAPPVTPPGKEPQAALDDW